MQEAKLYKKLAGGAVQCELCHHFCYLEDGQSGKCICRVNEKGTLYNLVCGRLASYDIEAIERMPLYHYLPGSYTYSLGTYCCNFTCLSCHNWTLNQEGSVKERLLSLEYISPEKVVENALKNNCRSITYSYNEPTIYFECYLEIMKVAQANNLKNIWISNGYMSDKCLDEIIPYIDAANIDLKSFNNDIYQKNYGADLAPILANLKRIYNEQIHLEITTLLIPNISNDPAMLAELSSFIVNSLDPDIPWHINKFSAQRAYKLQGSRDTLEKDIIQAYDIGKQAGLGYIYVGNMPGDQKENTYCPDCGELCIRRFDSTVERFDIKGACPKCNKILGIVK